MENMLAGRTFRLRVGYGSVWRDAPGDCREGLAGWTDQGGLYFLPPVYMYAGGRQVGSCSCCVVCYARDGVCVCVCVCACTCVHLHACVCTACAGVNRSHGDVAVVISQLA